MEYLFVFENDFSRLSYRVSPDNLESIGDVDVRYLLNYVFDYVAENNCTVSIRPATSSDGFYL